MICVPGDRDKTQLILNLNFSGHWGAMNVTKDSFERPKQLLLELKCLIGKNTFKDLVTKPWKQGVENSCAEIAFGFWLVLLEMWSQKAVFQPWNVP